MLFTSQLKTQAIRHVDGMLSCLKDEWKNRYMGLLEEILDANDANEVRGIIEDKYRACELSDSKEEFDLNYDSLCFCSNLVLQASNGIPQLRDMQLREAIFHSENKCKLIAAERFTH